MLDVHARHLADLFARDRLRTLAPIAGADFASNDYLGLAAGGELAAAAAAALARGVPVGAGASRLLRGNHPEHVALEAEAAAFFGAEAALFLSSGYAANVALFATLPQAGDLVLHDALVHASAHDGLRLGRAEVRAFAHNDATACEAAIDAWRRAGGSGRVWIAVESVYGMDGDRAPLAALAAIADRHDAFLVIDEAHATGVFGERGEGLAGALHGRDHVVTLHTGGKALGCEGALLCLPATLRDFMVNRGRPFIFSTAPSPLIAATLRASLRLVAEADRRDRLHRLVRHAEAALAPVGVVATGTPILPLIVGEDGATMRLAAAVQAAGFDVRGIRPPTVPPGTARLRVSITNNVTPGDIDLLAAVLQEAMA